MNDLKANTVLGKIIRLKLKECKMTQNELAHKIGTSNVYLNCIVTGKRTGKKYIGKIFDELSISRDDLGVYLSKMQTSE